MTLTKTVRLQIIKPIDYDWNNFEKILKDIQKETRIILNKTTQLCWEYEGFSSEYKDKFNVYPKKEEILKYKDIHGYCYDVFKNTSIMYSANLSQTIKRATDKWKACLNDIISGKKSIPSYKKDESIDVVSGAIKIEKDDGKYYISLNLVNKDYKKQNNMKKTSVKVLVDIGDNSKKQIIERIINKEYKLCASQIVKHKRKPKWFINLSYQFEPKHKNLDKNNILGVDMGIKYPIYLAINNSPKREKIDGGEIESFRKRIEARRRSILKQGKYCGNGRIGRGIKTRIKPIELLSDKIRKFRETCNHKYSKFVVDFAIKNNCGVIQMEDLTGIADGEKKATFLGNWSYYDLQQKIKYKAEEHGIDVRFIDPSYTSQRCSKCGFIHKENRKEEMFHCINCGFKTHADYNAAKNIATKDIEKIIEEQLQKQEMEYKNGLMMEA